MELNERIKLFEEMVTCNYNMYIWKYTSDGHLLYTNCPEPLVYETILVINDCKKHLLEYGQRALPGITYPSSTLYPLVVADMLGLTWIALYRFENNITKEIYILGPTFTAEASLFKLSTLIDKKDFSVSMKASIMDKMQKIVIINSFTLFQYAVMFHYCINEEPVTLSDLVVYPDIEQIRTIYSSEEETSTNIHHGVWQAEQKLMQMIEDGNLNYKEAMRSSMLVSKGVKITSSEPLRQAKDSEITFTVISTRAAIHGGLSPHTAYTLNDYYVQSIENCKSISEVMSLGHLMYDDFIHRVHNLKNNENVSQQISSCCEYIDFHICDKIAVQEIATHVGYTDYYLTRKFKKEVGININDYINKKKIDYSKILLSSTTQSIQEISEILNFCSRSYFGDVFQKFTGMSPTEYRTQNIRI